MSKSRSASTSTKGPACPMPSHPTTTSTCRPRLLAGCLLGVYANATTYGLTRGTRRVRDIAPRRNNGHFACPAARAPRSPFWIFFSFSTTTTTARVRCSVGGSSRDRFGNHLRLVQPTQTSSSPPPVLNRAARFLSVTLCFTLIWFVGYNVRSSTIPKKPMRSIKACRAAIQLECLPQQMAPHSQGLGRL